MSGLVNSAVISEAVSRLTTFLTGKCGEHKNVNEWIDRLVMPRIMIKSAVKESEALKEEFDIDIDEELHEWQEKLKEALCQAAEALSNFPAKILHEEPNQTIEGGPSSYDQSMQEEGSDYTTLSHPASNTRGTVTYQVNLEANLLHDQSMHEEGTDEATLVHPATNIGVAVAHQVNLEANLPHDQSVHEEGSDEETLGAKILRMKMMEGFFKFPMIAILIVQKTSPWPAIIERLSVFSRLLDPRTFSLLDPRMMVVKYLENDEKVSKLIKTVEKLEKLAGNIGNFIKLLELQKKRKMSRKRKRSGVALQTYALFCYREDPYLFVIMLFLANCDIPTGITSDIFIGFIM